VAATPYVDLPDHRFWRKAVSGIPPFAVDPIVDLPFRIHPEDKVATGGSCFAQHIANRLQSSGFQYYQAEPAPAGMGSAEATARGYGMYSCRYGNLYTTRQLLQLFDRAFGTYKPTLDWWKREDGKYVDPFRPRIEPNGFATIEELHRDRETHLAAVKTMFETLDVFLFTFGLTESWVHKEDGAVLQLAPGVAGGEWDESKYAFWNSRASEVANDFLAFAEKLWAVNPKARLIVSVSPVPIIATYMPRHALVSNSASKSTLRVACDEVVAARPEIAYFPSYDLVSFGPNAARYYKDSLRELNPVGLSAVMRCFFDHFADNGAKQDAVKHLRIDVARETAETAQVICDEEAIDPV
jgi:hypothetical protein